MQRSVLILSLCFFCACSESTKTGKRNDSGPGLIDSESGAFINDQTEQHPAAPEGGYQIATPVMTIQPYSEIIFCYYGTYEGPDVGVVDFTPYTHPNFNHHSVLRTQFGEEAEDGELVACGESMDDADRQPEPGDEEVSGGETLMQIVQVKGIPVTEGDWLALPEGYAVKLESGTRWAIDTHFINPTDEIVLVNDTMNFGLIPPDQVTDWIAAMEFRGSVDIPPQTEFTRSFDCTWDQDYEILSLFGHMHHLGKRFTTDWTHDGEIERIYEVADWLSEYRENPRNIVEHYAPGEFNVSAGDVFTVNCTWDNPSASSVAFPEEMCSLHGAFTSSQAPLTCIDAGQPQ
jgi:hypothetical protein